MPISTLISFLPLVALIAAAEGGAQNLEDPEEEIRTCARMADAVARFGCYESLGNKVLAQDHPEPVTEQNSNDSAGVAAAGAAASLSDDVAATAPDAASTPVLNDDLGGGQFSENGGETPKENRGQVTSCQIDSRDSYYFIFDNGQVWQQNSRRRYKLGDECNFIAIITKDTFGYKLRIEGEDFSMRVKRIR